MGVACNFRFAHGNPSLSSLCLSLPSLLEAASLALAALLGRCFSLNILRFFSFLCFLSLSLALSLSRARIAARNTADLEAVWFPDFPPSTAVRIIIPALRGKGRRGLGRRRLHLVAAATNLHLAGTRPTDARTHHTHTHIDCTCLTTFACTLPLGNSLSPLPPPFGPCSLSPGRSNLLGRARVPRKLESPRSRSTRCRGEEQRQTTPRAG